MDKSIRDWFLKELEDIDSIKLSAVESAAMTVLAIVEKYRRENGGMFDYDEIKGLLLKAITDRKVK